MRNRLPAASYREAGRMIQAPRALFTPRGRGGIATREYEHMTNGHMASSKISKMAATLLIAAILGVIAAFAVWAQEPFLAPSLGSAVFTQLLHPNEKSAMPHAILVGQILGAASGFAGVFMAGAMVAPPFMGSHPLDWVRVPAIVIAGMLAAALQLVTGALTPAGGATALVVALGGESANWHGVVHLAVGLVLVTVLGEAARKVIVRQRREGQRPGGQRAGGQRVGGPLRRARAAGRSPDRVPDHAP